MESSPPEERVVANEALLGYAVGTINTQYYDHTGGFDFSSKDFYGRFKEFVRQVNNVPETTTTQVHNPKHTTMMSLETRDGAVEGLHYLLGQLNDPFSKYLTRDELRQALESVGRREALQLQRYLGILGTITILCNIDSC